MTQYFNEAGGWSFETIETVLRRRGHVIASTGQIQDTLFPEERIGTILNSYIENHPGRSITEMFGAEPITGYMDVFGRTGVRKMLRKLVHDPTHTEQTEVLAGIAGKRFERAMSVLEALQLVVREGDTVRLSRIVPYLGRSLEHYVAKLGLYELRGTAQWGINLEGVGGGDFDVVAWLPPTLVYVECKAGNPADISRADLQQVLRRTSVLAPDLTIVLVDTEGDLAPIAEKLGAAQLELLRSDQSAFFLPPSVPPALAA